MLGISLARFDDLVRVARVRVDLGESRPMELGRLEIERARLAAELAEANSEAVVQRRLLRLRLGPGLPEEFRAEGDLESLPPLPSLGRAIELAIARNPHITAAHERARAAAARVRAERAAGLPEVSVGVFREEELDSRTWGAALEMSLPLWNRNGGGVARARAAARTADLRSELSANDLEAAVRATHARASNAYAKARSFQDVIRPKARETTAALEKMYQIGEIGVMDVLDARRSRIEIESELLQALFDSRIAALRLLALTGEIEHE